LSFIPLKNPLIRPATSRIPFFENVLFSALESYYAYAKKFNTIFFLFAVPTVKIPERKIPIFKAKAIIA
jgi:hypothetical protein